MRRLLLLSSLLLVACNTGDAFTLQTRDMPMNPIAEAKTRLTFTCAHEIFPEPSAESDVLFKYARWLQKNNQLKQDDTVYAEIERLYRIAAENGHAKANINLQNGGMRGQFKVNGDEYLRLSQNLIDAGVASGYYFVGIFLEQGAAGLKQDQEMALRYFRKAADQGSAQAQYDIGDKLEPRRIAPEIAFQMYRCAAEQGHGKAGTVLGIYLKNKEQYQGAAEAFQLGVAGGYESAAGRLEDAFRNPPPSNKMDYLDQQEDLERAERYKKIWEVLANYSYANPEVPEINDIVPLPPAPLPAWDGKLQWLEARLANIPPEKPSEALINQLAKAMVLDPATGKPMPGSPGFSQAGFPLWICLSGEACKQTGYWKVIWSVEHTVRSPEVIRHFEQGDILPKQVVERFHMRMWPFPDKTTFREEMVEWGLLG
jgi:TPR repeat protein